MKIKIDKYLINIPDNILSLFKGYKQRKKDNESGGIIMGEIDEDGEIFVKKISLPNIYDKSSRCYFERDKIIAKLLIDYEFHNSEGKTVYLGEWHTHPEPTPTPSDTDIRMIKSQYQNNNINGEFLLLIIQGTKDLYVAVYDGKQLRAHDTL
jgi:integrative and conjugative element protein (TIGR02256 family)